MTHRAIDGHTELEAHWDTARGRIREAWGALTDDDLDRAAGRWDQVVGAIREKTGEKLADVEQKIDDILDDLRQSEEHPDR